MSIISKEFNVAAIIDEKKNLSTSMSDKIWASPESHFKEKYAVSLIIPAE